MQDVKEQFRVEKQHLEERISVLEMRLHTPSKASESSTHTHRSVSHSDDPFPTSEFHEFEVGSLMAARES